MANAVKARGQHVQQEAAHELLSEQGHCFVARSGRDVAGPLQFIEELDHKGSVDVIDRQYRRRSRNMSMGLRHIC